jgi:hypothetical protein
MGFSGYVYGEMVDNEEAMPEFHKCKSILEKQKTGENAPAKS